jgi:hypothetical protein
MYKPAGYANIAPVNALELSTELQVRVHASNDGYFNTVWCASPAVPWKVAILPPDGDPRTSKRVIFDSKWHYARLRVIKIQD